MDKRNFWALVWWLTVGVASAQVPVPPTTIQPAAVSTSDLGFLVKTVGLDWAGAGSSGWLNSVENLELALGPVTTNTGAGALPSAGSAIDPNTGRFATNCANFLGGNNPGITAMLAEQGTTGSLVPSDANGFWTLDAKNFTNPYINCDANGPPPVSNGLFNSPQYPHNFFPGVPTCANPANGNDYESIACSFMGYVFLPAGPTTLNVNSDDGFLLMLSPLANPYDARGLVPVGEFEGGRGSATTTMSVQVAQPGWYTLRLDYEQGTGGILCELFSTDGGGNNVLVNDTTSQTALRAYPTPETFPNAYPVSIYPANGANFAPDSPPASITAALQDGTLDKVAKITAVKINGQSLPGFSVSNTPSFTPNGKSLGNITTVSAATPPSLTLPVGQPVPLEVDYQNSQGLRTNMVWTIAISGSNGVYRERWLNLNQSVGNTLLVLTNTFYNPAWPDHPTPGQTVVLTNFAAEVNTGLNYYGQRLRAYLVPPATGAYVFSIASDDTSSLFLSGDENPADTQLIAYVSSATAAGQYTAQPNQQSAPVNLTAGQRYYIEAEMEQGTGSDNLSVQWRLPDGTIESPIPGSRLEVDYFPTIILQPANTTVTEQTSASFTLLVSNFKLPAFQWREAGAALPGATNATLTLANVPLAESGAAFDCVISNFLGSVTSLVATLTVTGDTNPPTLLSAYNVGLTNVTIGFSKPVDPATAGNPANYSLSSGVTIKAAGLADPRTVALAVSPLSLGQSYTATVSGVQDLAASPNTIVSNSQISFVASLFVSTQVGAPTPLGSANLLTNGADVSAGGSIGGNLDSFPFEYLVQSGNFDVSVRVQSLGLASPWAKAGLMARAGLDQGSAFAAALATPGMDNCFFDSRPSDGAGDTMTGSFPVNYPNTWLRLKRVTTLFTGYASFDGSNWVQLGSVSLSANPVYLGMAAAGQNPAATALAQFRDYGGVSGGVIGNFILPREPLGSSSRRTQFVFSEIMYTPAPRADGLNTEYVEIYNSNPWWDDLGGCQLAGEVSYTFPTNTIVPGGGYLVVAAAPADVGSAYGITNVTGPYTGSLKKGGEIQLLNAAGGIVLDVTYTNTLPWPAGAHGTGHSIVLAQPSYGEADPRAWTISDTAGGSPGGPEGYRPSPLRNVVINEFLAHPSAGQAAYVELYNHSAAAVDLSGGVLTDDATTNKCVIAPNTSIAPGGFIALDAGQLGFSLNPAGGLLLFRNPDGSRVEDAVTYEGQALGVSFGRWPDGAATFYPLAAQTPGAGNGGIWLGDVAINEIMYKPISGNDDDQYVELYNKGTNTLHLGGWQFTAGISFAFPAGTVMEPAQYLVVARNMTNLFAKYPNLNSGNTVGNFTGKLPHKGGRLALAMTDSAVTTNPDGTQTITTVYPVEDEVTYSTGGRWGQWAHGGGSSLELINPDTNHRLAYNWADSDETGKSSWTNLVFTGLLDNGQNYSGATVNLVQVGLLDNGEALVDNISVQAGTAGPNLVQNPGFESGLSNWLMQGDHIRSGLETSKGLGGYQSGQSLHLRASDAVWTGYNSAQGVLAANNLASGQTATLSLAGRWLHGTPEILLRVRGNWIELTGAFPVPSSLGTPGGPNSRALTNPPPAIYEVKHTPPLPAANQAVVVTARFHSLHGFQPTLLYRTDTAANANPAYTTTPMVDNGTGGDALAGDGIYSATIPGRPAGTVVAFLVRAADTVTTASSVFPAVLNDNSGLPREGVVMFGDTVPTTLFGHRHLWLTQNWINRWSAQGGLSNEENDGTLVDGGGRVIYDLTGRYAGSPAHQYLGSPVGTLGGQDWSVPDDDLFLGATSFNKQHVPGNGPLDDNTIQREETSYWMARRLGLRWDYRKYYVLYVNGNRHGPLMEDSQTPDGDVIDEYWPNDNNGFLYKNNMWWEFENTIESSGYLSGSADSCCPFGKYTTTIAGRTGQMKLARYRWAYSMRQYPDSANNYTNVYALINAANLPATGPAYYTNMEALVDTEEYMRLSALEHATGDWDSMLTSDQWNMFTYKPLNGKMTLLKWDWNIDLGSSGSWGPDGSQLFTYDGDSAMAAFQSYPPYRRAMLRAFQDLANGPMNNTNADPVLDAKYAAFAADGLAAAPYNVAEPGAAGLKSWIGTMRQSLLSAIASQGAANVAFAVKGSTNLTAASTLVTLTGTAPLQVKTLTVNGASFPVQWTTISNWSMQVSLLYRTNLLAIQGVDLLGHPVAGSAASVTVVNPNAPPPAPVKINEWMAANKTTLKDPADGSAEDWFELYNPGQIGVDLSGSFLTHNLTNQTEFVIPSGTILPASGHLLVWADGGLSGVKDGAAQYLHANFKLGKSGASIALFDAGTNLADMVSFGAQTSDISQGRFPDGGTNIYFMPVPTPGAANSLQPGAVFTLSPIANQTLTLGQTLAFPVGVNLAQPPTALSFSLGAGSPARASLDPAGGEFSWTPPAPGASGVTIQVTANATPSLSAKETFQVMVVLPPTLAGVSSDGAQFVLSWTTAPGQTCQLESKDDLNAAGWTPLGAPFPGSGATVSVTNSFDTPAQRFFRLQIVP